MPAPYKVRFDVALRTLQVNWTGGWMRSDERGSQRECEPPIFLWLTSQDVPPSRAPTTKIHILSSSKIRIKPRSPPSTQYTILKIMNWPKVARQPHCRPRLPQSITWAVYLRAYGHIPREVGGNQPPLNTTQYHDLTNNLCLWFDEMQLLAIACIVKMSLLRPISLYCYTLQFREFSSFIICPLCFLLSLLTSQEVEWYWWLKRSQGVTSLLWQR